MIKNNKNLCQVYENVTKTEGNLHLILVQKTWKSIHSVKGSHLNLCKKKKKKDLYGLTTLCSESKS